MKKRPSSETVSEVNSSKDEEEKKEVILSNDVNEVSHDVTEEESKPQGLEQLMKESLTSIQKQFNLITQQNVVKVEKIEFGKTKISDYKYLHVIGVGAYGTVAKCKYIPTGEVVAIKETKQTVS